MAVCTVTLRSFKCPLMPSSETLVQDTAWQGSGLHGCSCVGWTGKAGGNITGTFYRLMHGQTSVETLAITSTVHHLSSNNVHNLLHPLTMSFVLPSVNADAVTAANNAAAAALRQLTQDLSGTAAELAAAMQLGVLLATLQEHSRAAKAAGWAVPLVGGNEQQEAAASSSPPHPEHDGVLQLRGLWPYWMSGGDVSTVKNDVGLDGFMLLTGPNMAGEAGPVTWSSPVNLSRLLCSLSK